MNYSKALNECIESAYMVAGNFGARYLESWHLLIAMSNHSYSVAGATLNDYPYEMDRLEAVSYTHLIVLNEIKEKEKEE